jgi:hypothetical protein
MKHLFLGLCIALLPGAFWSVRAQDIVHSFELSKPIFQVKNSLYNRIEFIDARSWKKSIGTIQFGLSPRDEEKIVFKTPIEPQLAALLQVLTDETAKQGTLVFQLRRFRFIETSGLRHCFLKASLYARNGEQYVPISHLNTMIPLSSGIWKTLQSSANTLILNFVSKALLQPAGDSPGYSLHDVQQIDSVEKSSVPLYTTTHFTEGIYRSAEHFLRQEPDWTRMEARTRKDGSIIQLSAIYPDGTKNVVGTKDIYAIVYRGVPLIATEYGYFPLERVGEDFYSVCNLQVKSTGAVFGSAGIKYHCQVMVDQGTGELVIIRDLNASLPYP